MLRYAASPPLLTSSKGLLDPPKQSGPRRKFPAKHDLIYCFSYYSKTVAVDAAEIGVGRQKIRGGLVIPFLW